MVGDGIGALRLGIPNGLMQGYATVSTDTGHDNTLNYDPRRQGSSSFAYDYQARLDYAEASLDSVATAAKRLIRAYYGEAPRYSYFAGCSNGGREGMVLAQRFPDQFDGIVAESPAFAFPKAAIAEAWDTQTFAALARREGLLRPDGLPDISRVFSAPDLALVAQAVVEACDELDGLADGMVQDFTRCTTARVRPALKRRICAGPKTGACLSKGQVRALVRSFGGPREFPRPGPLCRLAVGYRHCHAPVAGVEIRPSRPGCDQYHAGRRHTFRGVRHAAGADGGDVHGPAPV